MASAEIVGAASEVMHVHLVGVCVGDGDGLLSVRAQIVRPHVKRARVVQPQRLAVRKREAGVGGVARDHLRRAQLPARKNVLANKLAEHDGLVVHHNAALAKFIDVWLHNGVQHHAAAARKQRERAREEGFVTLGAEMFKRANADDAVNGFGEFFPALQAKVNVSARVGDRLRDERVLFFAQREADYVHIEILNGAASGGAPAATNVKQFHASGSVA